MKDISMIIFINILLVISIYTTNSKITKEKRSLSSVILDGPKLSHNYKNKNLLLTQSNLNFQEFISLKANNTNKLNKPKNNSQLIFPYSFGNFTIEGIKNNNFEIRNNVTGRFNYYNVSTPIDKFQYAENITCSEKNCQYPNFCIDKNTCACDNRLANFFTEKQIEYFKNKTKIVEITYCSYARNSPVLVSLFEFIFPGVGQIFLGNYTYGILKLILGVVFIVLIIIKIVQYFEIKNSKEHISKRRYFLNNNNSIENNNNVSYLKNDPFNEPSIISVNNNYNHSLENSLITVNANNKNASYAINTPKNINNSINSNKSRFYRKKNKETIFSKLEIAIIVIGVVLLLWLLIDFSLIGLRFFNDKNGVGLINYPNYKNLY